MTIYHFLYLLIGAFVLYKELTTIADHSPDFARNAKEGKFLFAGIFVPMLLLWPFAVVCGLLSKCFDFAEDRAEQAKEQQKFDEETKRQEAVMEQLRKDIHDELSSMRDQDRDAEAARLAEEARMKAQEQSL